VAETVPLFPLGTVLLPGAPLPLHIFEPRYRQLTVDLITGAVPDKQFGVIAVREGCSPDDVPDALHPVGCTAELREVRRLPDGRYDIVTRGARRFRLLDIDATSKPYFMAAVEFLPDTEPDDPDHLHALAASARDAHRRYCATAWHKDDWVEPTDDIDPAVLPHLLAADCLLPMSDRQALLEEVSPAERLKMVRRFLVRETGLLTKLRAVPAPLTAYGVEHGHN
jgi:Uncharacterized protein, similar to the N-terminal domain of Lon protease